MAGPSISALASLLVAATSNWDHDTEESHDQRQQQSQNHSSQIHIHTSLREAAGSGAKRKARALSKHRQVLARWTAGEAKRSDIHTVRRPFKSAGAGSTTAVADRSEEVRLHSNHVSPLLSLVSTERLGRHVVAAGALPAGTLLLRETPFAWSLHPEFNGEFCAHCLHEVTGSTVLCQQCGLVAYCSEACATVALRGWHGGECLDPSSGSPMEKDISCLSPACRVALRALRRARQHEGPPPPNKCEPKDEEVGREPPSCGTTNHTRVVACPDRASSAKSSSENCDGCDTAAWPLVKLRHLQEHYTARSARERELLETEAAIAAVLARGGGGGGRGGGLHAESDGEGDKPANEKACDLLAAELVTTLVKVSTNAFAVSSLRSSVDSGSGHVRALTHAKVAVGIYLAAAMLNHSCNPNALATFDGGEIRVIATRAIEKGKPVTISYGPLLSKVSSTRERQAYLRQAYFFQCECEACLCPTARTATAPASRPAGGGDGSEQRRDRDGATAEASWKRTEFGCCRKVGRGSCPGTLLLGVPLAPSSPLRPTPRQGRCDGEDLSIRRGLPVAEEPGAPPLSPGEERKLGLWCECCGTSVPPEAVEALLAEDEEDHRLWDEAMAAVSRAEGREEVGGDGQRRSRLPSWLPLEQSDGDAPNSATSSALGLVVERIEWRDARLCPPSMRRAVAHDMHSRILASQGDFAGAADACARAVHVLMKRFAPEDQELGVEFLKLAELCFNAGWMDKCSAACRKAKLSLELCLQPGDEQLVALDTLQGLCAEIISSKKVSCVCSAVGPSSALCDPQRHSSWVKSALPLGS